MSVERLLFNVAEQLVSFVGFVFLAGFIVSFLNRVFYHLIVNNRPLVYITGFIGTPLHELSHAAMCVLFGHKIQEIKLFRLDSDDGTLGYVKHTSNPRNLYQQIGNYFIGVAPIFVSSVLLFLAMKNFMPATYREISLVLDTLSEEKAFSWFHDFGNSFVKIMTSFFDHIADNLYSWIFILFGMCVSLHMNLSRADILGALKSLPLTAILLVAVNFILRFASRSAYYSFIRFMSGAGIFIALMLSLSLIFGILHVAFAFIVKALLSLFRR